MNDEIEAEARLRASLAEQSRRAPAAGPLTERIIAAADRTPPAHQRHSRRWHTRTLPLLAAASVAALVVALVTVGQLNSGGQEQPAAQPTGLRQHTQAPTPAVSSAPAQPASAPPSATSTAEVGPSGLANFHVVDLTFVKDGALGWALGTADCLNGRGSSCSAVVRTTDGGASWHSMRPPPANVAGAGSCADPCVRHLRFANANVGYAYGPGVLFMTTDGGGHWARQAGGARALETLDENVIRVSSQCRPGCPWQVQVAVVGSPHWRTTKTIDAGMSPGVSLARSGTNAALAVYGHTAGGARSAPTTLWVSSDDGKHWSDRGEPCPQHVPGYGEVDTTRLALGQDGSVTVLCTPRQAGHGSQFTLTSTDSGRTFEYWNVPLDSLGHASATALAAASAKTILVSLAGGTYRSTDGGRSYVRLKGNAAPGSVDWLGFETAHDACAVSADGRTIWTTQDAGATWSAYTFR